VVTVAEEEAPVIKTPFTVKLLPTTRFPPTLALFTTEALFKLATPDVVKVEVEIFLPDNKFSIEVLTNAVEEVLYLNMSLFNGEETSIPPTVSMLTAS
jgi:hypothetical protein